MVFYVTNLSSVSAVGITKTGVLKDGRFILEIIPVNNDFIILSLSVDFERIILKWILNRRGGHGLNSFASG